MPWAHAEICPTVGQFFQRSTWMPQIQAGPRVAPSMHRWTAVDRVPHVLIVDDDRLMRSMLASQLRIDGFIVHEAPNVLSARLAIEGAEPGMDLVILDIHLPGGSGLDLATRLRAESPELPIVLMTAFPDQGMRMLAHTLHAHLLGKPFELREFRAVAGAAAHWSS